MPKIKSENNAVQHTKMPDKLKKRLEKRVNKLHLQQRLGLEAESEVLIFGQGLNFFHPENWYSIHKVLTVFLRIFHLKERAKKNCCDIQINQKTVVFLRWT